MGDRPASPPRVQEFFAELEHDSGHVRYLNAGSKAGYKNSDGTTNTYTTSGTDNKKTVYGFYASKGKKITEIKCTNWVTSAPIGDLPRWARSLLL